MKKINVFTVLMMVIGLTFVSCKFPTTAAPAPANIKSVVVAEGTDEAKSLKVVKDERGEFFLCTKAVPEFEGYMAGSCNVTDPDIRRYSVSGLKNIFPNLSDEKLYISDEEYNADFSALVTSNSTLDITNSTITTGTITGTINWEGHTLNYIINK